MADYLDSWHPSTVLQSHFLRPRLCRWLKPRTRKTILMRFAGVLGTLALLLTAIASSPESATRAAGSPWPMYLGNDARTGYNGTETIINPTTAPNLKLHWTHQAGSVMTSQPVMGNGMVYWGTWDGLEHATDPTTGNDVWTANLGQEAGCTTIPHGVISSAEFTFLSINGVSTPVIFVGGGDVHLYALNASTGTVIWSNQLASPPSFIYGSPVVYNGSVYIGVSSYNDCPEVQGQLLEINESTGAIENTFKTVPDGCEGGGVWGSPAIDDASGMLYFATGDLGTCQASEPLVSSVIKLRASDLSYVDSWQIPGINLTNNLDFGNTPTLFNTTIGGTLRQMVGIINKNGIYYAIDRTNISKGPVWQTQLAESGGSPDTGQGSISSSAWDGTNLYVGSAKTIIQGNTCPGAAEALNPSSGAIIWQRCVAKDVLAAVTAVPGLVIVGAGPNMFVLNANTGKVLFKFHDATTTNPRSFWGPVMVANGVLYQGSTDGNLFAFGL